MEIENRVENHINFNEIRCGDMFRGDNGCYYMKLLCPSCYGELVHIGGEAAVNLATGVISRFDDAELVTPVPNAKIVI